MNTVLIIGASRGIGLALTQQYLAAGHRVIATARQDDALAMLKSLGAETLRVDVADGTSVGALAGQLDGEKIDLALYVAGVMDRASATTPPTQLAFDHVMHTNVLGAMQVIPQVLSRVEAAGGVFAAVSSAMGLIGDVAASNAWLYRVSKAALNMAVSSARHNYPKATLVTLHPGWVQTDMGGPGAALSVQQSAADLVATLASVTPADNGRFLFHDGRRADHW